MRLKPQWISALMLALMLGSAGLALAEEATHGAATTNPGAGAATAIEEAFPHPQISTDGKWAGTMGVIVIFCFFLPAAIIGPIVRANTPEEVPIAHAHDEPPGTSGHHGHSGTKMEEPHH